MNRFPLKEFGPPLGAWLAGAALLFGAAIVAGHDPLHASNWARFDSEIYEGIARHGYEVHRCGAHEGMNRHVKWCGNTAWFPAYPLLIAAASALGAPLERAALAISWLAGAATLVLLWRWFVPRRAGSLAYLAFAPGLVYLFAIYPLSLLTLAGVVFIRYLGRDDRIAAGAGVVAALAYPLGMALVPVIAVVDAFQRRRSRAPVRRALLLAGPAVLSGVALVVVQWVQAGRWTAYFDVASSYGGLHDPVTSVTDWVTVLRQSSGPFGYSLAPVWQLLFVTLLLTVTVAAYLRRPRAHTALLIWCVGIWFIPLLQSHQSLWRSEAGLLLLAPLVPRRLIWPAAVALAILAFAVAHEFFAGSLI